MLSKIKKVIYLDTFVCVQKKNEIHDKKIVYTS